MVSAEECKESTVPVDSIPLPSLLYRRALGYSRFILPNATDDDRARRMEDSRAFSLVFPAYTSLLVFSLLETSLLQHLPWIRTEKAETLKGYPTLELARLSIYSGVIGAALQLGASFGHETHSGVLEDNPIARGLFIGISVLRLVRTLLGSVTFLQLSKTDEARLAVVDVSDLLKIEEFNFMKREDVTMPLEELRKTLAVEDAATPDLGLTGVDDEDGEVEQEPSVAESEKHGSENKQEFTTAIKHADKTQEMLMQQLRDAGKVGIVYIPLDELNIEIAGLMAALNAGQPYNEARLDYLLLCLDANPDYKALKARELEKWKKSVHMFAQECLREMRTYISASIFRQSLATLQAETGYSVGLCRRLLTKKCLWLARIATEDICRMHEADLLNKFNPLSQGLDIVEVAAIYAQMPQKFLVDPTGKKERFRESIVTHLKELVVKRDAGTLRESQKRCSL